MCRSAGSTDCGGQCVAPKTDGANCAVGAARPARVRRRAARAGSAPARARTRRAAPRACGSPERQQPLRQLHHDVQRRPDLPERELRRARPVRSCTAVRVARRRSARPTNAAPSATAVAANVSCSSCGGGDVCYGGTCSPRRARARRAVRPTAAVGRARRARGCCEACSDYANKCGSFGNDCGSAITCGCAAGTTCSGMDSSRAGRSARPAGGTQPPCCTGSTIYCIQCPAGAGSMCLTNAGMCPY